MFGRSMNMMKAWIVFHCIVEHQIDITFEVTFARIFIRFKRLSNRVKSDGPTNELVIFRGDFIRYLMFEEIPLSRRPTSRMSRREPSLRFG